MDDFFWNMLGIVCSAVLVVFGGPRLYWRWVDRVTKPYQQKIDRLHLLISWHRAQHQRHARYIQWLSARTQPLMECAAVIGEVLGMLRADTALEARFGELKEYLEDTLEEALDHKQDLLPPYMQEEEPGEAELDAMMEEMSEQETAEDEDEEGVEEEAASAS